MCLFSWSLLRCGEFGHGAACLMIREVLLNKALEADTPEDNCSVWLLLCFSNIWPLGFTDGHNTHKLCTALDFIYGFV